MSERFFYALGEPAPDAATANARFGALLTLLGSQVADAEVDLAPDAGAPDGVRTALATVRATRRLPWGRQVRVRPPSGGAWDAMAAVAGWTGVVLYDAERVMIGAVHDREVSGRLTSAEAEVLGARLGVEPAQITSPPTGMAALLTMRPRGAQR
ncbi:hypothetical protein [Luteimicrobium subarcticum]|uniref:Uncharacterized protein n=1 Tax=Luteimicrobium subarcticum TaxID=620910 RepID=A0A2M8WJC2_9MICO|nr:hypothetical protein [Luteimicrobium subarcticum]PJI91031.1 hypothetical protein CLV34_2290 [Luteimicrobium subarcticum]